MIDNRKNKVLIFDFDGVLIDSMGVVTNIIKHLAKYSLAKSDREMANWDIEHFRSLSSDELYFRMPKWKIALAVLYGRKKMSRYIQDIKPIGGVKEELERLKKAGYVMGIVSSNSAGNIKNFLKVNKIECFDFIYSGSILLKKEKKLRKVLKNHGFDSREAVFVADETRDIEAARKNNIKIIAVSWGYTDKDVLLKYQPDYIADQPQELSGIIDKL